MREIIQPIRGHNEEEHHPVMVQKRATHFPYKEKTVMVQNILGKRDISKKKGKGKKYVWLSGRMHII